MFVVFLNGFALGFGLILAIGAQNAFVLRQGLRPVVRTTGAGGGASMSLPSA